MSYPILYSATETNFDHNGFGILGDCVSCEVTEEANGIFELAMQYPMDGIHFEDIAERSIIKAKSNQLHDPQLFRVYAISRPMSGIVTVLAEHISYDLSGIPVSPFYAPTAASAMQLLKENAVVDCPFQFWTDKETMANFKVSVPASIRSRLGGVQGSLLDVYGGEYEFDNYTVKLHNKRGKNNGVSIRYGKNLTDIKQEQNCSAVATGVYPYWSDAEGNKLVVLPEKIVEAPGTYNFVRIRPLDLSAEFEAEPTVEQLRSKAESYVKDNNIGIPSVSLTVSYAQLEQSEEYKHFAYLEQVDLFDIVNVEFPDLGVSTTAKVVMVVYDAIADRVESVTLGSVRANIADTVAQQSTQIVETAKAEAIRAIKGQTSEDIFNYLTDNGKVQGIYIQDGKWYINSELVKIINLVADRVQSLLGDNILSITGSELYMASIYEGKRKFSLTNYGDEAAVYFFKDNDICGWYGPGFIALGEDSGTMPDVNLISRMRSPNGRSILYIDSIEPNDNLNIVGKTVRWKSNGDGTFTLIGS